MHLRRDDLTGPEIAALLRAHLDAMQQYSPPESIHALDLEKLREPDISFWTAWEGTELLGCGALREIDPHHAELKSMRTAEAHLRRGVAAFILEHLLAEGRRRGYTRISLETGAHEAFEPARRLYAKHGFAFCGPFADYRPDPYSVFMTKALGT